MYAKIADTNIMLFVTISGEMLNKYVGNLFLL